jgi:serine/threonine protein kinase/tetratricopeptide (TPR) repeat protein
MIGKTISHYKIIEKLGEGGMGVVYLAEDTKLKRKVAIKFLPRNISSNKEDRKRFEIEAQAAAALNHPSIAHIYAIEEADDEIFIVMEYINGIELKEKISSGPIQFDEAINIATQIAEGLDVAHKKGIVHRDIKSSNIMITEEGKAKIMDFGLAKIISEPELTKIGSTVGTAAYMSPEQTKGEEVHHRTDIWSFGVVMYEMLTGELPFKGDYEQAIIYSILNEDPRSIGELRDDTPSLLTQIIQKTLQKNPVDRYQTTKDIIDKLNAVNKPEPLIDDKNVTQTIAVLPFANMSNDKEQEYFCDGMAEDIINDLTHLEGLHVVARTSSFAFKNKNLDIREIGMKLSAHSIVEGSVRKAGNRLRITAQLINVSDGYHLWSERYDRDFEDVFAIQDEIAKNIVQALEIKLSKREKRVLGKIKTQDVQAYDYYLHGRNFFYKGQRKSIEFALEMFSNAISKDPDYALAYAGIADCSSWFFMYVDGDNKYLEKSLSASQKAIELDSESAEAHSARGLAISLSNRFEDAEEEFETSISLNPNLFVTYYFFARICFVQGKLEKAAQLFEQACIVNPEDYQSSLLLGNTYKGLKLIDKSHSAFRRGLEIAKRHLELNPDDARAIYLSAHGLIELGEKEKGLEWANRALATDPDDPVILYNISCAYALLGRVEEAISYLEKALKIGYTSKEWIEFDSYLDSIRNHPRFQKALKKLD